MTSTKSTPVPARVIAEEMGVTPPTVHNWFKAGIIPAVVHEGQIVRYDLEQVRGILAARAEQQQGK